MRRFISALVGAAAVSVVLAGCSGGDEPLPPLSGTVLQNPYAVSSTSLADTEGSRFSLTEQTDKPLTLVFFGYTQCPDICPRVLNNLASAMVRLDDDERADLDVVFVTTDPARDDGPTIRSYLDAIDPSFIGVTADLDTIIEVGDSLKLYVSDGEELPSGGYDLGGHTTSTIAIDRDDQAYVYWSDTTSPAEFADDIRTLLQDA
ncbi:MAG: SCO family protein [Nocardioides sp.]